MKINKYLILGCSFLLLVGLSACKSKKKLDLDEKPEVETATLALWNTIQDKHIDFDWYYAKARTQVQFEGMTIGGRADIRIRRDSAILMSVSKFGFELARTLIRPDSVFALNRIEASYVALPYDSLTVLYDIPFDFKALQELVVGNQYLQKQVPISSVAGNNGYILKSRSPELDIILDISQDYVIRSGSYQDQQGRSVELFLEDEREYEGFMMPGKRSYYYPSKEEAAYSLFFELEKVEINSEKKMKFEIPGGYKEM